MADEDVLDVDEVESEPVLAEVDDVDDVPWLCRLAISLARLCE